MRYNAIGRCVAQSFISGGAAHNRAKTGVVSSSVFAAPAHIRDFWNLEEHQKFEHDAPGSWNNSIRTKKFPRFRHSIESEFWKSSRGNILLL